jgi:hypothetical protein
MLMHTIAKMDVLLQYIYSSIFLLQVLLMKMRHNVQSLVTRIQVIWIRLPQTLNIS